MPKLICPVCNNELYETPSGFFCDNRHCYDKAKSGYVNLLLSSHMNSKAPGDNKLMIDSRASFLSRGYYSKLKDEFCKQIVLLSLQRGKPVSVIDSGCGEGYYTVGMAEALRQAGVDFSLLGIDISKIALKYAAKRAKSAGFMGAFPKCGAPGSNADNTPNPNENGAPEPPRSGAQSLLDGAPKPHKDDAANPRANGASEFFLGVASSFSLPVADNSCDIVTELFSPFCRDEFYRVLKSDGILLSVIPDENHLYELKQAVYDEPYKNEVKDYTLDGFKLSDKIEVKYPITLGNTADIENLFMMTPYYYKTSAENTARLKSLAGLTTALEFQILTYRKCT